MSLVRDRLISMPALQTDKGSLCPCGALAGRACLRTVPAVRPRGGGGVSPASSCHGRTPVTRIDIASQRVETCGGNAIIRRSSRSARPFAAVDFQQLEGVEDVAPRERIYFRSDPERLCRAAYSPAVRLAVERQAPRSICSDATPSRAPKQARPSLTGSSCAGEDPVDEIGRLPILRVLVPSREGIACDPNAYPSDAAWRV